MCAGDLTKTVGEKKLEDPPAASISIAVSLLQPHYLGMQTVFICMYKLLEFAIGPGASNWVMAVTVPLGLSPMPKLLWRISS